MATEKGTYYPYDASGLAGNIVRITNAQGVVTGSFEYNAWGLKLQNSPPPEGTRYGMSAPAYIELKDDPDGVLVVTPTRAYHRGAGRFLQRDSISRVDYVNPNGNHGDAGDSQQLTQATSNEPGKDVFTPAQWPVLLEKAKQLDQYMVAHTKSNANITQAVRNLLNMIWDAELSSRQINRLYVSVPGNLYAYSGNPIGDTDPTGQAFKDCGKAILEMQRQATDAAKHFGQNAAYYATHGTLDPGEIREKKQILGKLTYAIQQIEKYCLEKCPKEAYEKAKETLAMLEKQISAFADAVANLDWTGALTALRNVLIAVAILLALALAALPALALA